MKIYKNSEFIYREYVVMQPLQRSYAITQERIESMLSKGALSALYDDAKVNELENAGELSGKDERKLENYYKNKPLFDSIIATLQAAVSNELYLAPEKFMPILSEVLSDLKIEKKLLEKLQMGCLSWTNLL